MNLNDLQNNGLLKLVTPFYFGTPKGYGLEFLDPFYHIRNTLRFLPARVETDIWNEVNFVFDTNNHVRDYLDGEVLIKAGDPICIAVPYKKTLKSKLQIKPNLVLLKKAYYEKFKDSSFWAFKHFILIYLWSHFGTI